MNTLWKAWHHWKTAVGFDPKRYWTERGRTYIREFPPGGSRSEELILDTLAKIKFQTLVEIGCGYGRYLKCIAERFPGTRLAGIDISPTQISEARKYLVDHP